MSGNKTIPDPKLARIESDAQWARGNGIQDFSRDHGNLLIQAQRGGVSAWDIGYLHDGNSTKSYAAGVLRHASPGTMIELVRGYQIAKKAGLL